MDDAISGERWRLWMAKNADGAWVIQQGRCGPSCVADQGGDSIHLNDALRMTFPYFD